MADSWTALGNSALIKLGASTMNNIDSDTSKGANLARLRYQPARDVVLRSHLWNCAMNRVVLSPLTTPVPAFTFAAYFALPADLLRVVAIDPDDVAYRVEGRYLASDEDEMDLKYIYQVTDPTQLDVLCSEAIATYLAWDICFAMTQNSSLKEALWKEYFNILRYAKSVDAKEDPVDYLRADLWIDSRSGPTDGPLRAHNSG